MVISDAPPFLFVHVPKTAGLSLVEALKPEGQRDHPLCTISKHETASRFVGRHGRQTFERYYSFGVVRHPLEQLLSQYAWLKDRQAKPNQAFMQKIEGIDAYVEALARNDPNVVVVETMRLRQYEYLYDENGTQLVNEVIRFEDLPSAFEGLCRRIGLEPRPLPKVNASDRSWAVASPSVEQFVRDFYRRDLELFGYRL